MSDSTMAARAAVRIALGGDEAAFELKEALIEHVRSLGFEAVDFGTYNAEPVLYPDIAVRVARAVAAGEVERGVLVCGTGIGVAISANKVPGIRAAQAHDTYSAIKRARAMMPKSWPWGLGSLELSWPRASLPPFSAPISVVEPPARRWRASPITSGSFRAARRALDH